MLGRIVGFLRSQPEEIWFFLRIAAYAIFIGTVYWFLTYEAAGTFLLYGFGIAAGFGTVILGLAARDRRKESPGGEAAFEGAARSRDSEAVPPPAPDGPFGDERGRIPGASVAPVVLAVGVAFAALGLVFGPWLIAAGLAIGLVGAVDWARSASAEYRAVEAGGVGEGVAAESASGESTSLAGSTERQPSRPAGTA